MPLRAKPSVFDVAPTVLTLLGLPVTSQMQGKVLDELIESEFGQGHEIRSIAASRIVTEDVSSTDVYDRKGDQVDQEMMKRLKSLGYID